MPVLTETIAVTVGSGGLRPSLVRETPLPPAGLWAVREPRLLGSNCRG